jgi:hypothetical protein
MPEVDSGLLVHHLRNYDVGMPQRAVWLTLPAVAFCTITVLAIVIVYAQARPEYIDFPW